MGKLLTMLLTIKGASFILAIMSAVVESVLFWLCYNCIAEEFGWRLISYITCLCISILVNMIVSKFTTSTIKSEY